MNQQVVFHSGPLAAELPAGPGAYALQLHLAEPQTLQIGRLGTFHFPAGEYIYLGSARGPGGLRARLGRHLAGAGASRAIRWHVDYLRRAASITEFADLSTPKQPEPPYECRWNQALLRLPGAWLPAPHFGASDCHFDCPAHLVGFPPGWSLEGVRPVLETQMPLIPPFD